jgi:hypothetical protein
MSTQELSFEKGINKHENSIQSLEEPRSIEDCEIIVGD